MQKKVSNTLGAAWYRPEYASLLSQDDVERDLELRLSGTGGIMVCSTGVRCEELVESRTISALLCDSANVEGVACHFAGLRVLVGDGGSFEEPE